MDEYFNNLINEFMLATGSKKVDKNSKQFVADFLIWLQERHSIGSEYADFLENVGFRFTDESCAEVGKGKFDSVVKPFDTTLITSAPSFGDVNPERIVKGDMKVFESIPLLISHRKGKKELMQIPNSIIHTYMTQNPYNQTLITNWEDLHNSGVSDIILGVFGSIHDKDNQTKIKQLQSLKDKLTSTDYIEEYSVSGDNYFYAIGSDRIMKKTKVKVKVKEKIIDELDVYSRLRTR